MKARMDMNSMQQFGAT